MTRPDCAGRDDDRSYSEGPRPSTRFLGTLALPLEETMRLILNVIWLIFGGLWLALGYLLAALVCFLLSALGMAWTRGNLIGAGLFFLTLALAVT